ncbi:MAG: helix-turn-helix transcriptional regulator [Lachnospiraceae bacterium]|nr:helix-turn-helix transcriptional regulator [Lachnospiraceae bacterium]
MKLQIGETIKCLRREKGITQEELAEVLSVSCQSVSRWELGTCYPDIELLPEISNFFAITVDKLIGADNAIEKNKVDEYLNRYQEAISHGNIALCIQIAREGVKEFPNNYTLLNKLMYALFLAGDEDGNIPDWKEKMQKYDAEITALGERIMKYCPEQNIRLEAASRLAFNHCEMGRKKQGRAIYETLPPQQFCRESHIWWALDDDEKLPFTRDFIRQSYENLRAGLYNMVFGRLLPDKELISVCKKTLALDALIRDKDAVHPRHYLAQFRCLFARIYARLGQTDEAMEQLRIAANHAAAFDSRPEEGTTYSLLLGETNWKHTDFESDDSRSCRDIMLHKWLAHSDFDAVRDSAAFQQIIHMLKP